MISIKSLFIFIGCSYVLNCSAQKTIDTIATKLGNLAIPIKIYLPKKSVEKSPIYFFVHGGGWNGGTQNEVPSATLSGDVNFLANELGIIYVGLAYRCKGNNATFADAINDLEQSPDQLDLTFLTGSIPLYENDYGQMVYVDSLSNEDNVLIVYFATFYDDGDVDDAYATREDNIDYETLETIVSELSEKLQYKRM